MQCMGVDLRRLSFVTRILELPSVNTGTSVNYMDLDWLTFSPGLLDDLYIESGGGCIERQQRAGSAFGGRIP